MNPLTQLQYQVKLTTIVLRVGSIHFNANKKFGIQTLNLCFSFVFNAKQNNALNSFNFRNQDLFFINLLASKQIKFDSP